MNVMKYPWVDLLPVFVLNRNHYKPTLLGIEHFPSRLTWKYLDLLGLTWNLDLVLGIT